MNLFLLRHGMAVDFGAPGVQSDSDRPLTQEGKARMTEITAAMKKLGLSWDVIFSSPYVRTRQTAEIAAHHFGLEKVLMFSEHLACGGDPKKLFEEINEEHGSVENILIVGHEPYLSSLISTLVTGRVDSEITMKKGGLCKLSLSRLQYRQSACLEWLLTPKQLCAMIC